MSIRASILSALLAVAAPALAQETSAKWPGYQEGDYTVANYKYASGETLAETKLHYRAMGTPKRNAAGQVINAVLLLQGNTGTGANWLRPERSRLAIRAGNWAAALELAEPGSAKAALTTAAALAEPDPRQAAVRARQAWRLDPALTPAVLAYAESQRAQGHESVAQSAVRHAWSVAPHPDLATFALGPVTDVLARAKAAQKLAGANPEHAESRLLLARTSLDAGLVGEARHQAEAALASGIDQRRFHLLLADIADAEHLDPEAARTALRHAADGGPDPAWHCDNCHAAYPAWHAACPACATPGSLRWTVG